jgi:hypothetical protein
LTRNRPIRSKYACILGADGSFVLYEDAGDSYDYEHGAYTTIPFRWNDVSRTLTIGKRNGAYEGMLKKRTLRIVLVDQRHGGGLNESAEARAVAYSGKEIHVMESESVAGTRAADLVSRMTLEEKVLQMQSTAPAIPRLGVPAYNWWNEALHGVAAGPRHRVSAGHRAWEPPLIPDLMHRVADAFPPKRGPSITTRWPSRPRPDRRPSRPHRRTDVLVAEHQYLPGSPLGTRAGDLRRRSVSDRPHGRRVRHRACRANDPHYLKVVSTPKHYAVHSGPEPQRHVFDAKVSEYDLVNTYLPAFRAAVTEGKADSIMCVYNSVNGVPGCASTDLLQKRLREQWGFQGYVVSDCGAVATSSGITNTRRHAGRRGRGGRQGGHGPHLRHRVSQTWSTR